MRTAGSMPSDVEKLSWGLTVYSKNKLTWDRGNVEELTERLVLHIKPPSMYTLAGPSRKMYDEVFLTWHC